jgi:hypothetical protein
MKIQRMPFFHDFAEKIMDGSEFGIYRVQALSLAAAKDRAGFFEKIIKGSKRVLVVNYYLSLKLDTLFILTAHITRAGEPREKEKESLQKYITEIKLLEGEK